MADEAEQTDGADGEGEDAAKGGGKKKLILLIALPVVVLLLAGAAAFLLLGGSKDAEASSEAYAEEGEGGEGGGEAKEGEGGEKSGAKGDEPYDAHAPASDITFYQLPDVLVNIQSADGKPRYLKLSLTLELNNPELVAMIEPAMPRVMDRFQAFLRELRVEDLSGSQGSYRLRLELLRRINLAVAPAQVRAVLIEEMLVQ